MLETGGEGGGGGGFVELGLMVARCGVECCAGEQVIIPECQ